MLRACMTFVAILCLAPLHAQQPARTPTIEERTTGMQKLDGYFPLYWEERTGNLYLEIARFDTDFLYTTGLAAGLGSNDIGLDRGQQGAGQDREVPTRGPASAAGAGRTRASGRRARTRRNGNRWRTRSRNRFCGDSRWRRRAMGACWWTRRISFCAMDTARRPALGAYRVDRTRSAFYLPRTEGFPKNTEIEVTLTFTNEPRGGRGGSAAAGAGAAADHAGRALRGGGGFGGGLFSGQRGQRDADGRSGDAARALLLRRIAGRQLRAALRRSARGIRRADLRGLLRRRSASRW